MLVVPHLSCTLVTWGVLLVPRLHLRSDSQGLGPGHQGWKAPEAGGDSVQLGPRATAGDAGDTWVPPLDLSSNSDVFPFSSPSGLLPSPIDFF